MAPRIGIGDQGQASCQRTASASRPPTKKKSSAENRNWMPMTLWSREKTYLPQKAGA